MASLFRGLTLGELQAILQHLDSAGMTAEMLQKVNKNPELADVLVGALEDELLSRQLEQYAHLLNSIRAQGSILVDQPHRNLSPSDFEDVILETREPQRIDSLDFLFHTTGDPVEDLRLVIQDYEALGFRVNNPEDLDQFKPSPEYTHPKCRQLKPGVSRMKINLVANWPADLSSFGSLFRDQNCLDGEVLTGLEALVACALQNPLLIKRFDGKHLPGICTGMVYHHKHEDWVFELGFCWDSQKRCIQIVWSPLKSIRPVGFWSVPVLVS